LNMDAKEFLECFNFEDTSNIVAIIGGPTATPTLALSVDRFPEDQNVFFGPASRSRLGNLKEDVVGTVALWVDVDNKQPPLCTLPPSLVVSSGGGWHLYWLMKNPIFGVSEIERLNKILIGDVPNGDPACFNANRILRIPGSVNTKYTPPVRVTIKEVREARYSIRDIEALTRLDSKTRHKVRTGDIRGYHSRSERDWSIIMGLISAGFEDELIHYLFAQQPCGDKYREVGEHYLLHSLEKAREQTGTTDGETADGLGIVAQDDGYYTITAKGPKRISTFTIDPTVLLDGSLFGAPDAITGIVSANTYTWPETTFSRTAFTTINSLDKECPIAAWQWLGADGDVRRLLPFLLARLQEKGLPKVTATPVVGLHTVHDITYFVGDEDALTAQQHWMGKDGPVTWLPSKREHPKMCLEPVVTEAALAEVCELLPRLNRPDCIWPMLGWYAATVLKPWLETQGYRFPVLNVAGTKGSGKTTLIQKVFMPLFGQTDAKSYDAHTTRFVTLALLGSANAVPIAFSEFRYEQVENFLRFVLLSYDTGHDPRGRSDQTTIDYPLMAPFSVDGEDMIEDPAARERLIAVRLHPSDVGEGSPYYTAFHALLQDGAKIPNVGGYYIQQVLRQLAAPNILEALLKRARQAIFTAFPNKLPERVRNNHIVDYFGILLWCEIMGIEAPEAGVLQTAISNVFDLESGTSRTLADSLVEDAINECMQNTAPFKWSASSDGNIVYFHLATTHNWWLALRRRQGRGALERDAIDTQLKEASYVSGPVLIENAWMYGVDLGQACARGLDVPTRLFQGELRVKFST
jgi:hypothetical protein